MAKRKLVEKPYANGTLSKSAFFGMIRSALRKRSMFWKPVSVAKEKARRNYKGKNKRQKFEYLCAHCAKWFAGKEVQVDHIVEAGSLKSLEDLPKFVERLFCEADGLQVLCKPCHQIKTNKAKKKK